VTEKSNHFWVVVHLYNDSVIESRLLEETMQRLSAKFKYIKCLKIRAQQAIENWPERNVPTLFVYYEGELKHQMITLQPVGGKTMKDSGKHTSYYESPSSTLVCLFLRSGALS
jgi:hypothetical protein